MSLQLAGESRKEAGHGRRSGVGHPELSTGAQQPLKAVCVHGWECTPEVTRSGVHSYTRTTAVRGHAGREEVGIAAPARTGTGRVLGGNRLGRCAGTASPFHVRAVPRAQAVLYLIDQLIISGIQLHIGFR